MSNSIRLSWHMVVHHIDTCLADILSLICWTLWGLTFWEEPTCTCCTYSKANWQESLKVLERTLKESRSYAMSVQNTRTSLFNSILVYSTGWALNRWDISGWQCLQRWTTERGRQNHWDWRPGLFSEDASAGHLGSECSRTSDETDSDEANWRRRWGRRTRLEASNLVTRAR